MLRFVPDYWHNNPLQFKFSRAVNPQAATEMAAGTGVGTGVGTGGGRDDGKAASRIRGLDGVIRARQTGAMVDRDRLSARLQAAVDALPLEPGLRVIEVGGAPGAAARAVARRIAPDGRHPERRLQALQNLRRLLTPPPQIVIDPH